jgi:hypothetical protein
MKHTSLFFSLLLTACSLPVLFSCSDDNYVIGQDENDFAVYPVAVPVSAQGGRYVLRVTGHENWDVNLLGSNSSALNWCVADKSSGTGSDSIVLTVTPSNSFVKNRTILVQVSNGKKTLKSKVIQDTQVLGEKEVLINGQVWSTVNVGEPGTFVDSPDDIGLLYQFNRKVGYQPGPQGDPAPANWPGSYTNDGTDWLPENSPCPPGWRMPTTKEMVDLWNIGATWVWAGQTGFTHDGIIIGIPTAVAQTATKDNLKQLGGLFLPVCGWRNGDGMMDRTWLVAVRSATALSNTHGGMSLGDSGGYRDTWGWGDGQKDRAAMVRPIKDLQIDTGDDSGSAISSPEFVFGFVGQNRYSYCPSIIRLQNGDVHMFFCGNPNADVMVDNIYHVAYSGGNGSDAVSVLQPSVSGSWDDHHDCDPSVIEGQFLMDGKSYKYAMFFLGNANSRYYNEIGVAFSNDLNATSWTKYPGALVEKTWSGTADQVMGNGAKAWGVGQPSAVSLDKKGKVLLTYTIGDQNGTRLVASVCDFSDMGKPVIESPKTVSTDGLYNLSDVQDYICNADIAINQEADRLVMIRPLNGVLTTYPTFIPEAQEIDWISLSDFVKGEGTWTKMARVTQAQTSFPRNHNAGLLRDAYGSISDWEHPSFYFTVSKASPDVSAQSGHQAEWTYHIYRSKVE